MADLIPYKFNFQNETVFAFFDPLPGSNPIRALTIKQIWLWSDGNTAITGISEAIPEAQFSTGLAISVQARGGNSHLLSTNKYLITLNGTKGSQALAGFIGTFKRIINQKANEDDESKRLKTRIHLFLGHYTAGLRNGSDAVVRIEFPNIDDNIALMMADLRIYSYIFEILAFVSAKGRWWAQEDDYRRQNTLTKILQVYTELCHDLMRSKYSSSYCFRSLGGFSDLLNYFLSADVAHQGFGALDTLNHHFQTLVASKDDKCKQLADDFHAATVELANLLIEIDGVRTREELEAIDSLKILHTIEQQETRQCAHKSEAGNAGIELTIEDCLSELNALIGLESVKKHVNEIVNVQINNQRRMKAGLMPIESSYHVVFTGNPGTGKTTVARIMGRIYRSLGLLSKGHFTEATKSDIVAGYIGQTAIKMREILDAAKGGILFIDEAYSLIHGDDKGDQFAKEAITEMLKYMEDNRTDIAVIAAGYQDEMIRFIDSNPGLRSRFLHFIDFPDYSPQEMLDILCALMKKYGLFFGSDGDKLHYYECLSILKARPARGFGNGRTVRSLFEKAMRNQALRLRSMPAERTSINHPLTESHQLQMLVAADLPKSDLDSIF